jgi:membrane-bound inhibitor of C-type lysozyme
MYRFAFTVLVPIVVSACAGGPYAGYGPGHGDYRERPPVSVGPSGDHPASPLARSATYTCEDLTTIVLTEGQPTAQVTLNSGLVLNLARQPDALGLRYGAPPYEFRARGGEATFFRNDGLVRCRAR